MTANLKSWMIGATVLLLSVGAANAQDRFGGGPRPNHPAPQAETRHAPDPRICRDWDRDGDRDRRDCVIAARMTPPRCFDVDRDGDRDRRDCRLMMQHWYGRPNHGWAPGYWHRPMPQPHYDGRR